jgi:hypothetical protein
MVDLVAFRQQLEDLIVLSKKAEWRVVQTLAIWNTVTSSSGRPKTWSRTPLHSVATALASRVLPLPGGLAHHAPTIPAHGYQ